MMLNRSSKSAGFTLIEIIAVLLILAVLAAVAIPRYLSLIDQATDKALDGALAAGFSQCSMSYAQQLLANGTVPDAAAVVTAVTANPPSGDFDYDFVVSGTDVSVTVQRLVEGTATGPTKSGTWDMP